MSSVTIHFSYKVSFTICHKGRQTSRRETLGDDKLCVIASILKGGQKFQGPHIPPCPLKQTLAYKYPNRTGKGAQEEKLKAKRIATSNSPPAYRLAPHALSQAVPVPCHSWSKTPPPRDSFSLPACTLATGLSLPGQSSGPTEANETSW